MGYPIPISCENNIQVTLYRLSGFECMCVYVYMYMHVTTMYEKSSNEFERELGVVEERKR